MGAGVYARIAQGVNPLTQLQNLTQVQQARFNLQQSQLQPAYSGLMALRLKGDNVTDDDVAASLADSQRLGGNVQGLTDNYSAWRARGGSPADFVRAESIRGMPQFEQFGAVTPQRGAIQTAAGTYYGTFGAPGSARPGEFTPNQPGQGFVPRGLSPPEQMQPYGPLVGPDGTPTFLPAGQVYGAGGGGPGSGGGVPASAATNNFGNIRQGSGFASYDTPQAGIAAMANQLGINQSQHGLNTLRAQLHRWAPYGDGNNNPDAYASIIGKATGLDPDAALDFTDPGVLSKVIPAMAQVEHGRPMGVSPDVLNQGIQGGLQGGAGGGTVAPGAGPFIGATSAQPVRTGGQVTPVGSGGVYLPAQPGGGFSLPPGYSLPGPGSAETWKASVDQFNAARANYANQANRISPLQQALTTLRANPNLETGPSAEDVQNLSGIARVFGWDLGSNTVGNANAYAEINKNLNRYYRSLPGASRSDMAELDAKLANPNTQMQREALDDLVARTIGLERANDAAFLNFQQQHGGGNASRYATQYADQTADYAAKLDPVGFAFDQMTPQQRTAYRNSLTTPEERTRYYNSIKEASRLYNLPIQ